ncbi:urea transporter [Kocuria marina]|uniref:urea transporter n=1 Tax=Kocuria marina TaxID=223184 RepID=UPI003460AD80
MHQRNSVRNAWFDRYTGTFSLSQNLPEQYQALSILDGSLRGVGQIFLMNNPLSGLLLVVAVATASPWGALLFLGGSLVGTLTALLLGMPRGLWRAGLYGFNGALVGILGPVFLAGDWNLWVAVFTLLAAALSTPIMHTTIIIFVEKLGVPALSITFGVLGVLLLLLAPSVAYGRADPALIVPVERLGTSADPVLRSATGAAVSVNEGLLNATLRGLSEVLLMDSLLVGLLVIIAIALCSPIAAGLAVAGSLTGALTAIVMGADGHEIYLGLWGYNGAVVAVALGGIVLEAQWRSVAVAIVGASASALLFGALSEFLGPYGVVPLSLPLVMVIIGTALAVQGMSRIHAVDPADYSTAEQRLRIRA